MSRMSAIPSNITSIVTEAESSTGTLRLEPQERGDRPAVRWTDDVIDNEHMNKKKSKICCIFHKTREFGESSSESDSSSSSSDSDSDFEGFGNNNSAPRRKNLNKDKGSDSESEKDDHEHGEKCNHDHAKERRRRRKHKNRARDPSPNAYERQPKYTPKTLTNDNVNSIDNRS